MFLINLILQGLAHSASLKKGLGVGIGAGAVIGIVYASAISEAEKRDMAIRAEQAEKWAQHKREGDLILENLNGTLNDLKTGVGRIDDRTFYLYKRELEKNHKQ